MIDHLNWRYATKQFDTTKKIAATELNLLKEAVRLTPTSYGIQPFKVIIVENPELREKLREKSYGQGQITDASHLFVFVAQNTTTNADIDALINLTAETRGMNAADLAGYGDYMKGAISYITDEQKAIWNAKQAYIGLGILLTQAASLKIDATPMEGFDPKAYDELLGLDGYHSVVVAALGYRHAEDGLQHAAKVRKSVENMFEVR